MRRDAVKAKDYAQRHNVPKWYTDAQQLIDDPEVNAIYIATPPDSHLHYALRALHSGKPVYLEKPMVMNAAEARALKEAVDQTGVRLTVAHYRREQPLFRKLATIVRSGVLGEIRLVDLSFRRPVLSAAALGVEKTAWRVDPARSGGGLFHDLAPHQLDIVYQLFGEAAEVKGVAVNQSKTYEAPDLVTAQIRFWSNVVFSGHWAFNIAPEMQEDHCQVIGTAGSLRFSFFDPAPVILQVDGQARLHEFKPLKHVQEPMIREVVRYFLGERDNPCPVEDGLITMDWMDRITG